MTRNNAGWMKRQPSALAPGLATTPAGQKKYGKPSGSGCGKSMAASVLVDTGALLALLDDKDEWHGTCLWLPSVNSAFRWPPRKPC